MGHVETDMRTVGLGLAAFGPSWWEQSLHLFFKQTLFSRTPPSLVLNHFHFLRNRHLSTRKVLYTKVTSTLQQRRNTFVKTISFFSSDGLCLSQSGSLLIRLCLGVVCLSSFLQILCVPVRRSPKLSVSSSVGT